MTQIAAAESIQTFANQLAWLSAEYGRLRRLERAAGGRSMAIHYQLKEVTQRVGQVNREIAAWHIAHPA